MAINQLNTMQSLKKKSQFVFDIQRTGQKREWCPNPIGTKSTKKDNPYGMREKQTMENGQLKQKDSESELIVGLCGRMGLMGLIGLRGLMGKKDGNAVRRCRWEEIRQMGQIRLMSLIGEWVITLLFCRWSHNACRREGGCRVGCHGRFFSGDGFRVHLGWPKLGLPRMLPHRQRQRQQE